MSNSSPFDWRTSVTSMPAENEKSWSATSRTVGTSAWRERLVGEARLLRVARQQRDRGVRFVAHQLLERVRQELGALARRRERERLDRRARARRHRPHVADQRSQHVLGAVDNLARRAIADAQRLDALVRDAEEIEQLGPAREAVLGRDRLRGVARQRDGALRGRRVEQHRQLQRREVLHLVDHQVLVGEHALAARPAPEAAALALVDAQQQRVVLGVERELLARRRRRVPPCAGDRARRTSGGCRRAARARTARARGARSPRRAPPDRSAATPTRRARCACGRASCGRCSRARCASPGSRLPSRNHCASAVTRASTGPLVAVPERHHGVGVGLAGELRLHQRPAPGRDRRLAIVDDPQHRAVRLRAHHQRRRLVGQPRLDRGHRRAARGVGPARRTSSPARPRRPATAARATRTSRARAGRRSPASSPGGSGADPRTRGTRCGAGRWSSCRCPPIPGSRSGPTTAA